MRRRSRGRRVRRQRALAILVTVTDLLFAAALYSYVRHSANHLITGAADAFFLICGLGLLTVTAWAFGIWRPREVLAHEDVSSSGSGRVWSSEQRAAQGNTWPVLALIVVWHLGVFAATLGLSDWWLGYGASVNNIPVPAGFDAARFLYWFLEPVLLMVLLVILGLGGPLGWLVYRIVTRRTTPGFAVFVRLVWRVCALGTLFFVVDLSAVAAGWMGYDLAMNTPLLWVLCLVVGPGVLAWTEWYHRYPPGFCQRCGYNLTGNLSGRCPECGEPRRVHRFGEPDT